MRVGFGYDIHRIVDGGVMMLGGIEAMTGVHLDGHSDGDVLLHAVIDSILGACSKGDIGSFFPDDDENIKGISSIKMLEKAALVVKEAGYGISNLDCVVVAEKPKISTIRLQIIEKISGVLFLEPESISVKGKTREGLGDAGKGLAIEAYSVAALYEL